jgi:hypothetical protein
MPLGKLVFKPGINRDQTNYASEGGWYECDKIRFRSGFPEKIGGWLQYNTTTLIGVCRSLFCWITTDGNNLLSAATNKKVYVESGTLGFDITPVRMIYTNLGITGLSATASVGTVNAVIGNPVTGVSANTFVGNETVYTPSTVNGNSVTSYLGVVGVRIT